MTEFLVLRFDAISPAYRITYYIPFNIYACLVNALPTIDSIGYAMITTEEQRTKVLRELTKAFDDYLFDNVTPPIMLSDIYNFIKRLPLPITLMFQA